MTASAAPRDTAGARPIRERHPALEWLLRPMDIASLAAFRIAFGAMVVWEVGRYFERGWVLRYYVDPVFRFPYEGFEWVQALPAGGMIAMFAGLGLAGFLLMAGWFYRPAATLVFLGLAYVFLLEQAAYLNHFYLMVLIGFLLILVPAHHAASIDAVRGRVPPRDWAPAWSVLVLRFQLGLVYFFGGIAKLNRDWLVEGEPLRHWLSDSSGFPLLGPLFEEPWAPYAVGWSGLAIDLAAPFTLLHRRTRPFMFAVLVAFHFINDRLFSIGIFPWFAIAATTIFFPPDWPRRFAATFRSHRVPILAGATATFLVGVYLHGRFELVPALVAALGGGLIVWAFIEGFGSGPQPSRNQHLAPRAVGGPALIGFLAVWAVVQIAVPLRHFVIPGDVAWTEEGHRFAWRMKLRSKQGSTRFFAYDPATRESEEIRPDTLLTSRQYEEMSGTPHMIIQFARYLRQRLAAAGKGHLEIRVVALASLNYGPEAFIIDHRVDLAAQTYSELRHNDWILPRPRE